MEIVGAGKSSVVRLLARDLDRRKPFSEKGTGFRDAAIWPSFLTQIGNRRDENRIMVVSANGLISLSYPNRTFKWVFHWMLRLGSTFV